MHSIFIRSIFLLALACCITSPIFSQVGINTTNPRTTLEVGGDMLIQESLDIGSIPKLTDSDDATFLKQNPDGTIKAIDVSHPTGAALGYIQEYVIRNANLDWVLNFDTRINANDFDVISISAYYDKELVLSSTTDNFSLPYTAAFVQDGTWRLIADFPSAANRNTGEIGTWTISTLIFSKDLSKQFGVVSIPMYGGQTGSASTPIIN